MKRVLTVDIDWLCKKKLKEKHFENTRLPNLTINQFWQVIEWNGKLSKKDLEAYKFRTKRLGRYLFDCGVLSPDGLVKVFTEHHEVYPFLNREEEIELVNIDLHHDICYRNQMQEKVDCGNWIYHLARQGKIKTYHWVNRTFSDTVMSKNFEHTYEFKLGQALPKPQQFDYIFIIKSPYYAPPKIAKLAEPLSMITIEGMVKGREKNGD